MGSIVRVGLRNRRVRGWITEADLSGGTVAELSEVLALSGRGPVFDKAGLEAFRSLALNAIHPLSRYLRLATPPRIGRAKKTGVESHAEGVVQRGRVEVLRIGPAEDPVETYARLIASLSDGEQCLVAVPEVREGHAVIDGLLESLGDRSAIIHSGVDAADRSHALWQGAFGERQVLLGGRGAVFAHVRRLGLIIVHGEHHRSMRETRAPYYLASGVAAARAEAAGARAILASPTPSLASLHRFGNTLSEPERGAERSVWPVVETVAASRGVMPQRAIAVLIKTLDSGLRSMVLVPRVEPGKAGPGTQQVQTYIARALPRALVSRVDRTTSDDLSVAEALDADIVVTTAGALAEIERPELSAAVALGVDALLLRPGHAEVEESFSRLWRLGTLLAKPGRAGRLVLETQETSHHMVQAIIRGDYNHFVRLELQERQQSDSPPFTRLVRLRSRSFSQETIDALSAVEGVEVLGPVPQLRGEEALVKISGSEPIGPRLRKIVLEAPAPASPISVEVDPRDE